MSGTPRIARQRGVALLTVLFALVVLSALAVGVAATGRGETHLVRNQIEAARARYLAEAGIRRGILALLDGREMPLLSGDGERFIEMQLGGGTVRISVQDECGKVDLNTGGGDLLRGLMAGIGMPVREAEAMVDAILDWRDPDDRRRPNGAERRDYAARGMAGPHDGPFGAVEELRMVMGMTDTLYRALEPSVTVTCLLPGIDPHTAPEAVLRAIPNVSEREVRQYVELRRRALAQRSPPPDPGWAGAARHFSTSTGITYTVRAAAATDTGAIALREAAVWLLPDRPQPYAILGWRELRAAP